MIRRYTLFGNPVEHSLSPKIHTLFAEQVQRRITYTTNRATEGEFASSLREYQESGAQGCNVTLPFKQLALEQCDKVNEAAEIAGSVNTIKFTADGSLHGFNTDGSGFITDITKGHGIDLSAKKVLLLGAGGAARGIVHPLLKADVSSLVIANRTLAKAEALVDRFSEYDNLSARDLESLTSNDSDSFDLVINSTSAKHSDSSLSLSGSILSSDAVAYDMSYSEDSSGSTPFVEWAREQGCTRAYDGIGMLLEQAADAFFIWEDVRPKTRMIMLKLR